jgi:uncharacterized protein (TIGR02996 family)
MSEQAGILQDIIEHPDDDTPRLVYADWLQDQTEGFLAEFIRAQVTLRQFLLNPEPGGRYPVAVEVMSIRPELRPGLLAAFRPVYEDLDGDTEPLDEILSKRFSFWVHRGLVEDVEVYGGRAVASFVRHAAALFSQVPMLRLTLTRASSRRSAVSAGYLGAHPPDNVALGTVRRLLSRPEIGRVRGLDLRNLQLGNAMGRCLLQCPPAVQPQRLLLDGNQIEADVAAELRARFGSALVLQPYNFDDDIPF